MLPPLLAEHFSRPRNVHDLPAATHEGRAENPACGDVLVLRLLVVAGRVERAAFRAEGCSALIACASLVTEALRGRTPEEALDLDPEGLVREAGGLPPGKEHAPAVLKRAIERALGGAP